MCVGVAAFLHYFRRSHLLHQCKWILFFKVEVPVVEAKPTYCQGKLWSHLPFPLCHVVNGCVCVWSKSTHPNPRAFPEFFSQYGRTLSLFQQVKQNVIIWDLCLIVSKVPQCFVSLHYIINPMLMFPSAITIYYFTCCYGDLRTESYAQLAGNILMKTSK